MTNSVLTLLSHSRLVETYASGHWRDDTIYALAKAQAARAPSRVAIRDRSGGLSYGELVARADAFAADLAAAGLRRGHRVAVWLPSRSEVAVALLACSRNGFICCPSLHRDHTTGEVIELLRRMRAAAFVGERGYGADAGRHDIFARLGEVDTLKRVFQLGPSGDADVSGLPAGGADAGSPNADPNIVVYLAFTSGTTGRPKGVMHSDNTLLAGAHSMIADWGFGPSSVIYTMSPLSHNLGIGSLIMAIAAGGEVVVHDQPRGASTLDRIVDVGATFVVGVPTHAIDLLAEMKDRGISSPGVVKGFRISGASAPREVVADLLRHGVVPQSGYGMTEAGSHHYTRVDDAPERIVQTSGRACDGYEIKIWAKDNPDQEVPVGEVGQIGGRGASLMLGYFDDQAINDEAFNRAGWFMTGDLGFVDEAGYLQITGRKKDLIIRGGHNIYPARIENLAMHHPAVARAAALPVADARLGEKVCIAVSLRPGRALEAVELLAHLDQAGLSRFDMPEYFVQVEDIPLTASGKILKREIAAQIEAGALTPRPVRWRPGDEASP